MKKPGGLFTKSDNQKRKRAVSQRLPVVLIALPPVCVFGSPWGPFSTTLIATIEGEDELPFKTPLQHPARSKRCLEHNPTWLLSVKQMGTR